MSQKTKRNTRKGLQKERRKLLDDAKRERPQGDSGFMYRHTGEMRRALRGVDTEEWRWGK